MLATCDHCGSDELIVVHVSWDWMQYECAACGELTTEDDDPERFVTDDG